ncbi:MAG: hypothetical protein ACLP0J_13300 [Solirubrobacteraceae bacterium]|jgi:hypothetical protein
MHAHRLTHLPSLTVLAALTALLLAACGASSGPSGSGSSGSSRKARAVSNAYKYPACMRAHGVTNFPDPQANGNTLTLQLTPLITGSPAFKSAQNTCAYLLPSGKGQLNGPSPAQQKARTDGMLAFAACMRKHGFPSFPDPTSQGQLTLAMITQAGINLQQPAVLQAGDACVSVSHGQITKGDVAHAVANPSASGSQSSTSG